MTNWGLNPVRAVRTVSQNGAYCQSERHGLSVRTCFGLIITCSFSWWNPQSVVFHKEILIDTFVPVSSLKTIYIQTAVIKNK